MFVYFIPARSITEKLTALFFEESIFSHSYIYIKEDRQIGGNHILLLRLKKGKLTKIPDLF